MQPVRILCVYCGSASGIDPRHREAATTLGGAVAAAGIALVYGGGRSGLMGRLADGALSAGGHVTGIIPNRLRDAELAHLGISKLVIVDSMHERKRAMAEMADAFAVLPGGLGTLDETFEIVTWRHLGLHDKPIFLVDIGGYWQPLLALLDRIVAGGFAALPIPRLFRVVPDIAALMSALAEVPRPDP